MAHSFGNRIAIPQPEFARGRRNPDAWLRRLPSISGHQSYWLWGPGQYTGESLLLVGESADRARDLCNNLDVLGRVEHPYSRGDEHFNIYWCHPLKENLQKLWPSAKHFD